MLFRFTGTSTEVFPTIITADGALVAEPGAVVELDADPAHPRLELLDEPADVTHVATLVDDTAERPLAPGQVRALASDVDEPEADAAEGADDTIQPRSRRRGATTEE